MAAVRPPDPHVVEVIRELCERRGVRYASLKLKFAQGTIARLAAGLPVSEGVALLSKLRVQKLEAKQEAKAPCPE